MFWASFLDDKRAVYKKLNSKKKLAVKYCTKQLRLKRIIITICYYNCKKLDPKLVRNYLDNWFEYYDRNYFEIAEIRKNARSCGISHVQIFGSG